MDPLAATLSQEEEGLMDSSRKRLCCTLLMLAVGQIEAYERAVGHIEAGSLGNSLGISPNTGRAPA
jgi:hypothetical protein